MSAQRTNALMLDATEFLADVRGFSLAEIGAYALVMAYYLKNGRTLPSTSDLERKLNAGNAAVAKKVLPVVLAEFFPEGKHKRLDEEATQRVQKTATIVNGSIRPWLPHESFDAAWKLTVEGETSINATQQKTGVSIGSINVMRKALRTAKQHFPTFQKWETLTWAEARQVADGKATPITRDPQMALL